MKNSVFVFPTDTSYGIGCDARNSDAVAKVFLMKGRSRAKSVSLIAASQKMVAKFVESRELRHKEIKRVMNAHWPGSLTLVLTANAHARATLARGVIARDGTIAIRVPDYQFARELSQKIGAPIVATSANKSGEPACYSAAAVRRIFKGAPTVPDMIIDEGTLPKHPASTIARFTKGHWEILRAGAVKL
ncbi:MAG: threonylcarbamoyl-AMP synthase [Candidatus Magasanikbacteria bacterium RIFCSPHIGHO2_01_FULL_50_8]|uniref:L-threonylcarbamoyladenylate synthase n=2 Tax=Candidatus Magasanikiibacteriota TaxID=1752731 RepID=A0A1F6LPP6_9BACT|nr:MAG: threonylcarbamoyl-AMP synthase [Candidatus Magasanikbacteria bacterium RIFCSPHIGHO2_01_FULL_50_8]OGH68175.1 MAG: threonylcarbamoyl-AMP synthase [Candidatus Magasanikbacteria bacterium RIFCSPHIGHO2_02_FULL_50_9b]